MKSAKTAFILFFCDELRDKYGPEVHHLVEEAETLLVDRQGLVVNGVYPTGGMWDDKANTLMRLQPGYAGQKVEPSSDSSQYVPWLTHTHTHPNSFRTVRIAVLVVIRDGTKAWARAKDRAPRAKEQRAKDRAPRAKEQRAKARAWVLV